MEAAANGGTTRQDLLMALSLSLGLLLLDRLVGSGVPAAMRECPGVAGGR
jgi:hypothetical protein